MFKVTNSDIKERVIYPITECMGILKSPALNNNDDNFIKAIRNCTKVSFQPTKGSLEIAMHGVRIWYMKEISTIKEEEVLKDLITPLLKPLLNPTTSLVDKRHPIYRRIVIWLLLYIYNKDLGLFYQYWINNQNVDLYWLYGIFSVLCLFYENTQFVDDVLKAMSPTSSSKSSLIEEIADSSEQSTSYLPLSFTYSPLISLSTLSSSLLSCYIQPNLKIINKRWLIPLYNATLYTLKHAYYCNEDILHITVEQCQICCQAYFNMLAAQHNPYCNELMNCIQHTQDFYSLLIDTSYSQLQAYNHQIECKERDGINYDDLRMKKRGLEKHNQQVYRSYIHDYIVLFDMMSTRVPSVAVRNTADQLLQSLSATTHCEEEKEKELYYALFKQLILHLSRLSYKDLQQFEITNYQVLVSLAMNASRFFKDIPQLASKQKQFYFGDIHNMILTVCKEAILHSQKRGEIQDMSEEFIKALEEKEAVIAQSSAKAMLTVCMLQETEGVYSTLMKHLTGYTVHNILSILNSFLHNCDDTQHQLINDKISHDFSHFIELTDHATNNISDELVELCTLLSCQTVYSCLGEYTKWKKYSSNEEMSSVTANRRNTSSTRSTRSNSSTTNTTNTTNTANTPNTTNTTNTPNTNQTMKKEDAVIRHKDIILECCIALIKKGLQTKNEELLIQLIKDEYEFSIQGYKKWLLKHKEEEEEIAICLIKYTEMCWTECHHKKEEFHLASSYHLWFYSCYTLLYQLLETKIVSSLSSYCIDDTVYPYYYILSQYDDIIISSSSIALTSSCTIIDQQYCITKEDYIAVINKYKQQLPTLIYKLVILLFNQTNEDVITILTQCLTLYSYDIQQSLIQFILCCYHLLLLSSYEDIATLLSITVSSSSACLYFIFHTYLNQIIIHHYQYISSSSLIQITQLLQQALETISSHMECKELSNSISQVFISLSQLWSTCIVSEFKQNKPALPKKIEIIDNEKKCSVLDQIIHCLKLYSDQLNNYDNDQSLYRLYTILEVLVSATKEAQHYCDYLIYRCYNWIELLLRTCNKPAIIRCLANILIFYYANENEFKLPEEQAISILTICCRIYDKKDTHKRVSILQIMKLLILNHPTILSHIDAGDLYTIKSQLLDNSETTKPFVIEELNN